MKKLRSKKGFTLMEMLIVVAIIGILVAIAIPVFNSQLTSAKAAVQTANQRSAKSMAVVQYLLDEQAGTGGASTYYAILDSQENMTISRSAPTTLGVEYYSVTITSGAASAVSALTKVS